MNVGVDGDRLVSPACHRRRPTSCQLSNADCALRTLPSRRGARRRAAEAERSSRPRAGARQAGVGEQAVRADPIADDVGARDVRHRRARAAPQCRPPPRSPGRWRPCIGQEAPLDDQLAPARLHASISRFQLALVGLGIAAAPARGTSRRGWSHRSAGPSSATAECTERYSGRSMPSAKVARGCGRRDSARSRHAALTGIAAAAQRLPRRAAPRENAAAASGPAATPTAAAPIHVPSATAVRRRGTVDWRRPGRPRRCARRRPVRRRACRRPASASRRRGRARRRRARLHLRQRGAGAHAVRIVAVGREANQRGEQLAHLAVAHVGGEPFVDRRCASGADRDGRGRRGAAPSPASPASRRARWSAATGSRRATRVWRRRRPRIRLDGLGLRPWTARRARAGRRAGLPRYSACGPRLKRKSPAGVVARGHRAPPPSRQDHRAAAARRQGRRGQTGQCRRR